VTGFFALWSLTREKSDFYGHELKKSFFIGKKSFFMGMS